MPRYAQQSMPGSLFSALFQVVEKTAPSYVASKLVSVCEALGIEA